MPRTFELKETHLLIQFSGLTRFMSFKNELSIPYRIIRQIGAGEKIPFAWKIAGVAVGDVMEGHFRRNGEWHFYSFERIEHTLHLELEGGDGKDEPAYKRIVIGVDDPDALAEALRERCPNLA